MRQISVATILVCLGSIPVGASDLYRFEVNVDNYADIAKLVAEFGDEIEIQVRSGEKLSDAIGDRCALTSAYKGILTSSDIGSLEQEFESDSSIQIPACLPAPPKVPTAADVQDVTLSYMGGCLAGASDFNACYLDDLTDNSIGAGSWWRPQAPAINQFDFQLLQRPALGGDPTFQDNNIGGGAPAIGLDPAGSFFPNLSNGSLGDRLISPLDQFSGYPTFPGWSEATPDTSDWPVPTSSTDNPWAIITEEEEIDRISVEIPLPTEAVNEIRNILTADSQGPALTGVAQLVQPQPDPSCSDLKDAALWPFNAKAVVEQFAHSASAKGYSFGAGSRSLDPARILVLDTGWDDSIDFSDIMPESARTKISGFGSRSGFTAAVNLAEMNNEATPPISYSARWHGVAVGDLASGSRLIHPYRSIFQSLPKVVFGSFLSRYGGSDEFQIASSSLENAYRIVRSEQIAVINASFGIGTNVPDFESELEEFGESVVLVVAAGNDGLNLDNITSWPASLGGEFGNSGSSAVITVGAHEPAGNRSMFSRKSSRKIDIFAPGCDMIAATVNSEGRASRGRFAGTSFAAPVVSFTSALLSSLGLSAKAIKARIIVSSEMSSALEKEVYSRGRLSIPDALAIPFLLVRKKIGVGKVQRYLAEPPEFEQIVSLCGDEFKLNRLHRIHREDISSTKSLFHIWEKPNGDAERLAKRALCEGSESDFLSLELRDAVSGERFYVTLENVVDLITAERM